MSQTQIHADRGTMKRSMKDKSDRQVNASKTRGRKDQSEKIRKDAHGSDSRRDKDRRREKGSCDVVGQERGVESLGFLISASLLDLTPKVCQLLGS